VTETLALPRTGRFGPSRFRIGAVATLVLLLLGFVSIVWTPYPVTSLDVGSVLQAPGGAHWLGTDQLGRDVLSLIMKGILTSFVVSAVAVFIGAVIGVPLGWMAKSWPGAADKAIGALGEALLTFPPLLLAVILAAVAGPGILNIMLAIGLSVAPAFLRTTRDGLLAIERLDYVAAARLAGTGRVETVRRHVLPNLSTLLLAQIFAQLATGVMAEAALGFVGLGVQPPASSLGLLLRDAQSYASVAPVPLLLGGLALIAIVLAVTTAALGLRDGLPVYLRRIGDEP
jgi:peptide/nickel transport system permease protein